METILTCHYYDLEATVTMSFGISSISFHVTRCHQSADLDMYVAEPETYSIDSWHGLMSHPGFAERVLEALLLDIGVKRQFFPSIISQVYGAMSAMHMPFITLDVKLYLFSYEEYSGRTRPTPALKEYADPCAICLEDLCGDQGSYATRLPCSHEFHTGCIVRWLCSANTTCPLCRRDVQRGGMLE